METGHSGSNLLHLRHTEKKSGLLIPTTIVESLDDTPESFHDLRFKNNVFVRVSLVK